MSPVLGSTQKSVGLVPDSLPLNVSTKRVCSTVTFVPPTAIVERPINSPCRPTFSAGLCREQAADQRAPVRAAGGRRYAVDGHSTVEVVSVLAIDSVVTSRGTLRAPSAPAQTFVASVCSMIGTQVTIAQRPSVTIMDVDEGNPRVTPMRLSPSPPVVR